MATLLDTTQGPVKLLSQRWRLRGGGALVARTYKPVFSFEFKLAVIERFLAGEPATRLAAEFELSSPKLVRSWARKYRREGVEGLRPRPKGRPPKNQSEQPSEADSELELLRRENERLRAEVDYLGKLKALWEQRRR